MNVHCRTCLSKQWSASFAFDDQVKQLLEQCVSVKIERETHSHVICNDCHAILNAFHKFKQQFVNAQVFFEQANAKLEIKSEVEMAKSHIEDVFVDENVKEETSEAIEEKVTSRRGKGSGAPRHVPTKYECKKCDRFFKRDEPFKRHMERHAHDLPPEHPRHIRKLKCALCPKTYFRMPAYKHHLRTHERQTRAEYVCPYCSHETIASRELNRHIARYHADSQGQYKCPECGRTFHVQLDLDKHKADEHMQECPHCHAPKQNFKLFFYHMSYCSGVLPRTKVQCPHCERQVIARHLRSHVRLTHAIDLDNNVRVDSQQVCPICGKKLKNLAPHLRLHARKVRKIKCSFCGELFDTNVQRYAHQADKHAKERLLRPKNFQCTVCDKKFPIQASLKSHLRYFHSDEKAHECTVCGKAFKLKSNLTMHMRFHLDIRPFACPICDKKFHLNFHVKKHMSVHTGEKPFKCQVCPKVYASASSLMFHTKVHHQIKQPN